MHSIVNEINCSSLNAGVIIQYVKLLPINSKDERKQILVGIDIATNQIYNTISNAKNGTKIT